MADLYNQLRDLRKKLAESEDLEVFRVFTNAALEGVCAAKPKNEEELLEIKGFGEKKVKKYGKAILALVKQEQNGISNSSNFAKASSDKQFLISNEEESVNVGEDALLRPPLTPPQEEGGRKQRVTVSQYVDYLNLVLQKTADIKITGEVSGGKMYPSGFYFTLKDKVDESALSCYLPTYTYRGLGIPIEDGMEIAVEGMPRLVKRNGRFQFTVENVELVGEGALKKAYDLLKAKLEEEGLFARKRELPEFITSVGIITSRAGAVIHDFRNNLAKLGIQVYLKDVRVEGASSPQMVVEAVKWFNNSTSPATEAAATSPGLGRGRPSVDVIVLMRGGGSMEDLQGFNNEAVVRAVFGSKIPTIVSIGHDKDVPLAQLAADVMVSTPTAAAHAVSATWNRLFEDVPRLQSDLVYAYSHHLSEHTSRLALTTQSLLNWCGRLSQSYRRVQELLLSSADKYLAWIGQQNIGLMGQIGRIGQMQEAAYVRVSVAIESAAGFLEQANPERQLKLGYSIVKNKQGKVVRSKNDVTTGEKLETQVADGIIQSTVN